MWVVADFCPVLCMATAAAFARRRHNGRGTAPSPASPQSGSGAADECLPSTTEAAERQLGMLLRRMRAYQRAPYDFAKSRIVNDADFEHCLDLATLLSIRIAEFGGGLVATSEERERIRFQLVESVSLRLEPLVRPKSIRDLTTGARRIPLIHSAIRPRFLPPAASSPRS